MNEEMERNQEETSGFVIDSDSKAEWAIKQIREAQTEHDRLMKLVDEEAEALEAKRKKIDEMLESDTAYLKSMLLQYMGKVACKQTKAQETYQLLSGKLVRKFGGVEYVRDEERLLAWCKENDSECVKTKESVDWAKLKKTLVASEDGTVCTEYGEVIDCIKAERGNDKFEIKF